MASYCLRCFDLNCKLKLTKHAAPELLDMVHNLQVKVRACKCDDDKSSQEELAAARLEIEAKEIAWQRDAAEYEERIAHLTKIYREEKHGHDRANKSLESIRKLNISLIQQVAELKAQIAEYNYLVRDIMSRDPKKILEAMHEAQGEIKSKRDKSEFDKTFLEAIKK